jgi:hypothetical protein
MRLQSCKVYIKRIPHSAQNSGIHIKKHEPSHRTSIKNRRKGINPTIHKKDGDAVTTTAPPPPPSSTPEVKRQPEDASPIHARILPPSHTQKPSRARHLHPMAATAAAAGTGSSLSSRRSRSAVSSPFRAAASRFRSPVSVSSRRGAF